MMLGKFIMSLRIVWLVRVEFAFRFLACSGCFKLVGACPFIIRNPQATLCPVKESLVGA